MPFNLSYNSDQILIFDSIKVVKTKLKIKMSKSKRLLDKKRNDEYLKIFMEFDLDSSGGVSKH
jgi:hypothetical protein